MKNIGTRYIRL